MADLAPPPSAEERRQAALLARSQNARPVEPAAEEEEGTESETSPESEPQISTMMAIVGFLVLGVADVIGIVLLPFGLDDFWILDFFLTLPMVIYLFFKGMQGSFKGAKSGARSFLRILFRFAPEFLPYVGALPVGSAAWLWTLWKDRHPDNVLTHVGQLAEKSQPASMQSPRGSVTPKTNVAA